MPKEISDKFEGAVQVKLTGKINKGARYAWITPTGEVLDSGKNPSELIKKANEYDKKYNKPSLVVFIGTEQLAFYSRSAA